MPQPDQQPALESKIQALMTNSRLVAAAAALTRAIGAEDGTYIRKNISEIERLRGEVLTAIFDWKPELLHD